MKETKTIEFKQEVSRTFLKTVSAYANFGTGEVLFGVDDNGEVVGVDDSAEVCLEVENYVNANIKPVPRYTLDVRVKDQRELVVLTVFEGRDKPYYYHGKAYRRNDTADVEVDRIELNRLVLEGQNLSFEEVPSRQQDLTFDALARELESRIGVKPLDSNVLKTLSLCTDGEGYNNAAAVLADSNSFSGIDMVRFGSDESELLDRERLVGVSALDQLKGALAMFRTYYRYEKISGALRETRELVPEEAFREAVANALVHRQWDSPANIQIAFKSDGIRIVSPGGLPTGITFDEYVGGRVSILRNPIIGNVFYRLRYIEMFGTGVARILSSYEGTGATPEFSASDNFLSVALPVLKPSEGLTSEESTVLACFRGGRRLSRSEVEEAAGVGRAMAVRQLNALVSKGRIRKVGTGRATRYELV